MDVYFLVVDDIGDADQRDLATLTAQDFIDVVRLHAEDGVDFVTLHCGCLLYTSRCV